MIVWNTTKVLQGSKENSVTRSEFIKRIDKSITLLRCLPGVCKAFSDAGLSSPTNYQISKDLEEVFSFPRSSSYVQNYFLGHPWKFIDHRIICILLFKEHALTHMLYLQY